MYHDTKEKNFFQHFQKKQIIKYIVDYCCSKKRKQRYIHSPPTTGG